MPGRSAGHPIDPLAIIVSLEEQVNENAQRVDNAMRNLVDLARAVRSLVQKVETLHAKSEEQLSYLPSSLDGVDFSSSGEVMVAIATQLSLLAQRIDDVENRDLPQPINYGPEFQRTEATLESLRLQQVQLRTELTQLIAKKLPEGSVATSEEVARLGGIVEKLAAEHAKFNDRLDEYRQLKDSSSLLTIMKSEHMALQKRLDAMSSSGVVAGGEPYDVSQLKDTVEALAKEKDEILAQLAELADHEPAAPALDHTQLEGMLAPIQERLDAIEHATPSDSPDLEAILAPIEERLSAIESQPAPVPESSEDLTLVTSMVEELGRDSEALRKQLQELASQQQEQKELLAAFEAKAPEPDSVDTGELDRLRAVIEAVANDTDSWKVQLASFIEQQSSQQQILARLQDAQAGLEERIAEQLGKAPSELIETTAALKHMEQALAGLVQRQEALGSQLSTLPDPERLHTEALAAVEAVQAPLLKRLEELESRKPEEPIDYSVQITPLQARVEELEARKPEQHVDYGAQIEPVQSALEQLTAQQQLLQDELKSFADQQQLQFDTLAAIEAAQAPLIQRLSALEGREPEATIDHSSDIQRLQAELERIGQQVKSADFGTLQSEVQKIELQQGQLRDLLPHYAESSQIAKLMEHLADLQTRLARNSDQLLALEQNRNQGMEEQRKQLQNQLDIQERQRALLEEVQVRLEVQQEQIAAQHAQLAEMVAQAKQAGERRRRASDEEHKDPTMGPLIESALHIERGEYAEAVRCLEAARQIGDNPKIEQALELAKRMLETTTKEARG